MHTSTSFLLFILSPYGIGFLALCFWWRWWLLLPVGAVASALAVGGYVGVMRSDGPGMVLGVMLLAFLILGAGSGAAASTLMILGRALRWRRLTSMIVLPIVFLGGFGSYFAFGWVQQEIREARFAAPSEGCLNSLHPAELGDVDLQIPIAPGLFLWGVDRDDEQYILWSNPGTRAFCAMAETGSVKLTGVHFIVDGSPSRHVAETKRPFCTAKHAEYPWADMACNLIATQAIPDNPVRVEVEFSKGTVDWVAKERDAMKRNPVSIAPDGVRTYREKHGFYLERPDGYFARCYAPSSSSQPWLYCSVREKLSEDLIISYDFRTKEALFLSKSPIIAANARTIFDSLKR
jgi:hypothetical protein